MLILKNAALNFGQAPLFSPLNLEIDGGEICVLSAPSGAGKSTLLRWIAGIPTEGLEAEGHIWLKGRQIDSLPAEKRRVGLMFQQPLLFPHLSVGDNLGFGVPASVRGQARKSRIEDALHIAGLEGMGARDPETLSGGQQARIALLRTLLAEPEALLLDEPFSSLDDARRTDIAQLVKSEAERLKLPVLLVSHDPRDIETATDKVIELEIRG
jgi:putative thiamine transport system ATP-binding protein